MHTATPACIALGLAACSLLGGCGPNNGDAPRANGADRSDANANARVEADIKNVAANYRSWVRVSDGPQWAPERCAPPTVSKGPRFSDSKDQDTHGRKLYDLFCNQHTFYYGVRRTAPSPAATPIGFAIVKEAHQPHEVAPASAPSATPEIAIRDGKAFERGPMTSLFVMTKYAPDTPGTDQGWIYATLDATGKEVTSIGVIASCVECHREAKSDRLFGLKE